MHGHQGVFTRGQSLNLKRSVRPRNGKKRMGHDADEGHHPGVEVALYGDHHFGSPEWDQQWLAARALSSVRLAIEAGQWMYVVGNQVAVGHQQLLSDPNANHPRSVKAANLIGHDRFRRNLELQTFEVGFNRQKDVGQPAGFVDQ